MEPKKVILDTDIGTDIDDALALAYLLNNPRCELVGITTLTGEADVRAQMVSAMLKAAGREDIPIHIGAKECILIEQKERHAPQAKMLEKWPHDTDFPNDAITYLQKTIRENPGEITLLGISPMSNFARLFLIDPEIPQLIKEMYLMCGKFAEWDFRPWSGVQMPQREDCNSAFVPADIRGFMAGGALEMNALIDPYATAIVYQHSAPVHRSVGICMTHQVTLPRDEFLKRCEIHPIFKPILDMAGVWFENCDHVTFHDPLATVCAFEPDVCQFTRGNVMVDIESRMLKGYTHFQEDPNGRHEVASSVNPERFFEAYYSVFH